jgi:hypothetical protein
MSETVNAVNPLSPQSVWDQSITLRHIRNAFLTLLVLCALWYVWQFFRLEWHSKMGGLQAQTSAYHAEIPDDSNKFLNRHKLQHNNVHWLDANGDGVLDAKDPAFAVIKLWKRSVAANDDCMRRSA